MDPLENKLKTTGFWLSLGAVNHVICITVVLFGCAYSGFSCQGDDMKSVLSIYAFTIFTPQVALEMIVLLATLLTFKSLSEFKKDARPITWFLISLAPLVLYLYWQ